jgi:hypothetical protein
MRADEGIERIKSGDTLHKTKMDERSRTGRLLAHHKHVEMRNFIRGIKKAEGSLKEEKAESEEQEI